MQTLDVQPGHARRRLDALLRGGHDAPGLRLDALRLRGIEFDVHHVRPRHLALAGRSASPASAPLRPCVEAAPHELDALDRELLRRQRKPRRHRLVERPRHRGHAVVRAAADGIASRSPSSVRVDAVVVVGRADLDAKEAPLEVAHGDVLHWGSRRDYW